MRPIIISNLKGIIGIFKEKENDNEIILGFPDYNDS